MVTKSTEMLAEEKADLFAEFQRGAFIAGFMAGSEQLHEASKIVDDDRSSHDLVHRVQAQERIDFMNAGFKAIMNTIKPYLPESTKDAGWYEPAAVQCAVATLEGLVQAAIKEKERRELGLLDTINELHRAIEKSDSERKQAWATLRSFDTNAANEHCLMSFNEFLGTILARFKELEKSRDASNAAWDAAWQLLVKLPGTPPEGDFLTEFRKAVINFQTWRDELRTKWEAHGFQFLTRIVSNLDRDQDFFDAMETVVREVEGWENDRLALRRRNSQLQSELARMTAKVEEKQREILDLCMRIDVPI